MMFLLYPIGTVADLKNEVLDGNKEYYFAIKHLKKNKDIFLWPIDIFLFLQRITGNINSKSSYILSALTTVVSLFLRISLPLDEQVFWGSVTFYQLIEKQ